MVFDVNKCDECPAACRCCENFMNENGMMASMWVFACRLHTTIDYENVRFLL